MTRLRALLLAGCACALAGCELAPPEKLPTFTVPVSYKEAALWRQAHPEDDIPRGAWWTMFDDPALDVLEAKAAQGNPDLQSAAADYDRARAYAAEAEAGLSPQLGLGADFSANRQSADRPLRSATQPTYYGANTIDAAASYEVDLWGRIHDSVKAGRSLAQASAGDLATVKLSLQAELASDYLAWRGLNDEQRLLDDTVATYAQAASLTRTRFQGDIASSVDVSRAEAQLQAAKAQAADLAARRALLEHAIATLTGQVASGFTLAADAVPITLPDIPAGMPSSLLQRRPDIAAAERRVAAAASLIGVAKAAFYPALTLSLAGGFNATGLNLLSAPNSFWTLGSGLVLPLLDGGLRHAELSAAQAALRNATEQYRAVVLAAFQEVEDKLALLHWLGEESRAEDAASAAAKQTLAKALVLYRDGATTFLDVVTAQTAALDAERAQLELRTRRLDAAVGLIRALGGGWTRGDLPGPTAGDAAATHVAASG